MMPFPTTLICFFLQFSISHLAFNLGIPLTFSSNMWLKTYILNLISIWKTIDSPGSLQPVHSNIGNWTSGIFCVY